MKGATGRAVILLRKDAEGEMSVTANINRFNVANVSADDFECVTEWLESLDTWFHELKHLPAGTWVRYYIKFQQYWYKMEDHYYGGFEWDCDFDAQIVRTLRRGRVREPYVPRCFR